MYFGGDGTVEANIKGLKYTYPKVAITGIRMGIEPVDNANSAQFQQCPLQGETEDRGAACLWIINEDQYKGDYFMASKHVIGLLFWTKLNSAYFRQ